MTADELRQALRGVPGDYEVYTYGEETVEPGPSDGVEIRDGRVYIL